MIVTGNYPARAAAGGEFNLKHQDVIMKRREIFAGNWKMYKTHSDAVETIKSLIAGFTAGSERELVIFTPAPYARDCAAASQGSKLAVGMQNMYFEDEGAFTGEVSPLMVKDCGCRYVLIGHSERRHVFGETDADTNMKMKAAIKHGIEPMLCVGELLEEREKGVTADVIQRQVKEAFKDVSREDAAKAVIAYEPVWAIGTGKVATPEIAEEVHSSIRKMIENIYDAELASVMPILYGGSVKPDNIEGLFEKENIDGVLVGGASLKADSFLSIVNI